MSSNSRPADLSARDNRARIVFLAPTQARRSQDPEIASTYWKDCHGPLITSLGHLSVYNQHHLVRDNGDHWPPVDGVSTLVTGRDQMDGIAEFGFADQAGADAFGAAAGEAGIQSDEQNVFEVVVVQPSLEGDNATLFDSTFDPRPNGPIEGYKVIVALRRRSDASPEAFREAVWDGLAFRLAEHRLLRKVRISLVQDFTADQWDSPNVDNDVPIAHQYQAFLELIFADRLSMRMCHESAEFRAAAAGLGDVVSHVAAFPVRATHTLVFRGQSTLAGRLGASRAAVITAMGAVNQIPEDLL